MTPVVATLMVLFIAHCWVDLAIVTRLTNRIKVLEQARKQGDQ